MLAMQAEAGDRGLPSHAFHAAALKFFLESCSLMIWAYTLPDRDVSIKHVPIKQDRCVERR